MRRHQVAFALPLYRNATTPAIGVELRESLFGKGSGGLRLANTTAAPPRKLFDQCSKQSGLTTVLFPSAGRSGPLTTGYFIRRC